MAWCNIFAIHFRRHVTAQGRCGGGSAPARSPVKRSVPPLLSGTLWAPESRRRSPLSQSGRDSPLVSHFDGSFVVWSLSASCVRAWYVCWYHGTWSTRTWHRHCFLRRPESRYGGEIA